MKGSFRIHSKALSPYAQALRQVALKGSVALGPSAKEMELEMYRKGTLPADYRPPVQGRWDDTIERWAYAWQFPAEAEYDDVVVGVEKNSAVMQQLIEFGERLLSSPPSQEPYSGVSSTVYNISASSQVVLPQIDMTQEYDVLAESIRTIGVPSEGKSQAMMPAEGFSAEVNVPVAYLDDKSERSNASKELSVILEGGGLTYTEEGLIVAISALSRQHYYTAAKSIFDFAAQVGLGPNAEMYKALMKHSSRNGDVNGAVTLIEQMKGLGITPRIGNWHELMRAFHNAKDYPGVSQIVDNMKMYANIEPNEVTFALQLRALSKDSSQMNSLAESVQLFDQMENVNGYIAARPHYDALMYTLSQSPVPENRLRCEELARKMDLMGICWNGTTFLNLIRAAQIVGDIKAVERHLAKMRDDRVPVDMMHLSWAVQAHAQHVIRLDYEAMKEAKVDILSKWLDHLSTCFGIYELVVRRGWVMQVPFINALLRLSCQTTILSMEHIPSNTAHIGKFEAQASKIWNDTFDEWHLSKDVYSYECYIALLAHQQRIDEAEKLFQQMVIEEDLTPSRRTYECLIFMHLSSGEEGGAARALRYLEAMEASGLPIRPSLLKKIVRVNNAAGYKRDMKRRARRIMQAREEYLARKEEGLAHESTVAKAEDVNSDEGGAPTLNPLPIGAATTLAWWEAWKRNTVSKHELFSVENTDGTPKGESFEEKNAALAQLGIYSPFMTKEDLPAASQQQLLPKVREAEGEMAGGIWALDGGELAYPKDGGGPEGWGVRLWRERAVLRKEHQRVLDGAAPVPEYSEMGVAVRVPGDQLDVEKSGATSHGELTDWRKYPQNRYDDGKAKDASEMEHPVAPSAELVWQQEQADSLAAYKSDDELALESDNTFYSQMHSEAAAKTAAVVEALRNQQEDYTDIVGRGMTRRSKHDYLEKWREMYRHGTLEAPETPTLRFGRTPDDHHETMAASIRSWYSRNKKAPPSDVELSRRDVDQSRDREAKASAAKLQRSRRMKGRRRGR